MVLRSIATAALLLALLCTRSGAMESHTVGTTRTNDESSSTRSRLWDRWRRRAPPVTALQLLVDTATGRVVAPLSSQGIVVVTVASGTNWTVRAVTPSRRTRAVGWVLTSNRTSTTVTTTLTPPHDLCGTTSSGAFQPCGQLPEGNTTYTLTVTAYSCRTATCGASRPLVVTFGLVRLVPGSAPTPVAIPVTTPVVTPVATPVTTPVVTPAATPVAMPVPLTPVAIPISPPVPPPVTMPSATPAATPAAMPNVMAPVPVVAPLVPLPSPVTLPSLVPRPTSQGPVVATTRPGTPMVPVTFPVARWTPSPALSLAPFQAPVSRAPAPVAASMEPPLLAPLVAPIGSVPIVDRPVQTPIVGRPVSGPSAPSLAPVAPIPMASPVESPVRAPIPKVPPLYTCHSAVDSCRFTYDGECDAGTTYCATQSDCFDCDPCRRYDLTSCDACTQAGCSWCGADASCLGQGVLPPQSMSCRALKYATCAESTSSLFTDPLYDSMTWLYDMIHVPDVWKLGITGKGIGIRINDDGVDVTHPEFKSKFDVANSCSQYTPVVLKGTHGHGTVCASLAAGSGNSSCSVGIAPDARLSACRMLLVGNNDELATEAYDGSFLHAKMTSMHISSNSYGRVTCQKTIGRDRTLREQPCPFLSTSPLSPCVLSSCAGVDWSNTGPKPACEAVVIDYCSDTDRYEKDVQACTSFLDLFVLCEYNNQSLEEQQALVEGITNGRNGKGIIYVYASGNDFDAGADVNFEGILNSRFVISVGAVGKDKRPASYSTPGAALLVSAPGGDAETTPNMVGALAGGTCTDGTYGTSFACPVVSGVVALMLQVNNNLSWRDVQGIIATTSQKVFANDFSWTTNAAGLHHSYRYGFGIVDARAAVQAAQTWMNYGPEQQIVAESGSVNVTIAEFQTPNVWALSTVNVMAPVNFKVESVNVYIDLTHATRGDLDIVMVSPQGTLSLLAPGERPENTQLADDERWRLLTVRHWGESAHGNWTLRLVDRRPGDLTTCVNQPGWSVTVPFPGFSPIDLTCADLVSTNACVNGGQGPNFLKLFAGVATSIVDPVFVNDQGVSPINACCECGGGQLASTVRDVLKSWRIAVYGHLIENVS